MNIFIGGAWPYANGSLHLGHVAGLLPGDIIARYHRLKGNNVLYVSGSDCHGTPISLRAKGEGVLPSVITDKYHEEFRQCFQKLGFSYDFYSRTDQEFHKKVVQETIVEFHNKNLLYEKKVGLLFCDRCDQFLPDRYVEGICPHCNNVARGDQCDYCSSLLEPTELTDIKCKLCGGEPHLKESNHLYFKLSQFQRELEEYLDNSDWRENAKNLTGRYLNEKLLDRAVTRNIDWGVDIPIQGFEATKVYVWIEAVLGYLSASKEHLPQKWQEFWGDDVLAYYVHGKDNIPFHTVILPALLKGLGLHPPDKIISSEYLTIEGQKLSTSRNWAVWVPDILERYHPDSIRYFLTINGPEKRDADFSWREFIYKHNGEVLGVFGNLVNRTLVFLEKFYDGIVPNGNLDDDIAKEIQSLYEKGGYLIEEGELKQGLEKIFSLARYGNKYFDERKPWLDVKEKRADCDTTIYNCIQIIANLANLLTPFLPFTCETIKDILNNPKLKWDLTLVAQGERIKKSQILFQRIDKKQIDIEVSNLLNQ